VVPPARLIEGGLPTEAMIAHVLITKYADHALLYRQSQIYACQGIELDRSTLADWVGRAAAELHPLHGRLLEHLKLILDSNLVDLEGKSADIRKLGRTFTRSL
jgi:transposase